MPKQTFTMSDWTAGMNENVDPMDAFQTKELPYLQNMHVDNKGQLTYVNLSSFKFGDHEANVSGNITSDFNDIDRGLGNETSGGDNTALGVDINVISSGASDDLSWEDGLYNFKYTICKKLDNGVVEEGPLQAFFDGTIDSVACDATSVNMADDAVGEFVFKIAASGDFPSWASANELIGRVYYTRLSGQGSSTQAGYIHLCDLIYEDANLDGIHARPINTTLTGASISNTINLEEPPTSSSFEMNAEYPSDVGILDVTDSPFTDCESKVKLGMVTYVAKSGYIYRSVPRKPDIFPTDDWIDMTAYGTDAPCKAMYAEGNILYYFTVDNLIVFDVTSDTIINTFKGYGTPDAKTTCKLRNGVAWQTPVDNGSFDVNFISREGIKNISRKKLKYSNGALYDSPVQMAYNDSLKWLIYVWFPHSANDESDTYISLGYVYIYSFITDSWWYSIDGSGLDGNDTPFVDFGYFHAGDPSRYKKIYKIIIHGENLPGALLKVYNSVADGYEIEGTMAGTDQNTDSWMGGGIVEWTPNASLKERKIKIKIENLPAPSPPKVQSISIVYRMLNKF